MECVQHVEKKSVRIFVEKIYKMGCLEGSGVPVLYIGRTVPEGLIQGVLKFKRKPRRQRVNVGVNRSGPAADKMNGWRYTSL
jgi:hypothetical protein